MTVELNRYQAEVLLAYLYHVDSVFNKLDSQEVQIPNETERNIASQIEGILEDSLGLN